MLKTMTYFSDKTDICEMLSVYKDEVGSLTLTSVSINIQKKQGWTDSTVSAFALQAANPGPTWV